MTIPVISDVFGWLFKLFYSFSQQNYLITLFLFALVMKILLLPFGIKQQKNSIKSAMSSPSILFPAAIQRDSMLILRSIWRLL